MWEVLGKKKKFMWVGLDLKFPTEGSGEKGVVKILELIWSIKTNSRSLKILTKIHTVSDQ